MLSFVSLLLPLLLLYHALRGLFGLWLDDGLIRGQSQRCDTFDNDVLSSSDDFLINDLEVWAIS